MQSIPADDSKSKFVTRGLSGLYNLGNTCFMNSVLQNLFATDVLAGYILRRDFKDDLRSGIVMALATKMKKEKKVKDGEQTKIKSAKVRYFFKDSITYNFYRISTMAWSLNCVVKPVSFKDSVGRKKIEFAGRNQQDADEFLGFMLDTMHEETKTRAGVRVSVMPDSVAEYMKVKDEYSAMISKLPDDKKLQVIEAYNKIKLSKLPEEAILKSYQVWQKYLEENHSRIVDIFTGMFMNEVQCNECKNKSFMYETYNRIQLQIARQYGSCTLKDCFDEYTKDEMMAGKEKYQCDVCNKKTDAVKRICLWHVPDRLVIHLKRFDNMGQYTTKNNTFVDFPLKDLDLTKNIAKYVTDLSPVSKYELYGVVHHSGHLHGGHYIAYTKNPISGQWFEFNDDDVVRIDERDVKREVVSNGAYILFYKKQETKSEMLEEIEVDSDASAGSRDYSDFM